MDGTVYEGMWSHNTFFGKGRLLDATAKTQYVGNFVRGQKEGFGKQSDEKGTYKGNFKKGKYHGSGSM